MTNTEDNVLSQSIDSGGLEIFTDDLNLDGTEWTIKIFKESILSDHEPGSFVFVLRFHDICWDSELQAS